MRHKLKLFKGVISAKNHRFGEGGVHSLKYADVRIL